MQNFAENFMSLSKVVHQCHMKEKKKKKEKKEIKTLSFSQWVGGLLFPFHYFGTYIIIIIITTFQTLGLQFYFKKVISFHLAFMK